MTAKQLDLRVANLDCEHDAAAIERGMAGLVGIADLKVYPKAAKVSITYNPAQTNAETLKAALSKRGFPAQTGFSMPAPPKPWRNPKVVTAVVSGVLLLAGWLLGLTGLPRMVSTVLYTVAILTGGYYFGREAFETLLHQRKVGIELLMAVAAIVAALMGQLAEAAMLVFLYAISEAAEGYTEEKTRSAVKALMDLAPKIALVRREGREVEIPVEEVTVGDIFIVKPGQAAPTDGVVIAGVSGVDQSPVTGESAPVDKAPGDVLFAGSINGEGVLEVRANKDFANNTISRIIQMVEEAQERKGQSQRFIERFGARYSPLVLLVGALVALLPPLFFDGDWTTWITRATIFIVAAAPCALVISIPVTLVAALGTGARQGVLIKGGVYVEELARVKVIALDKTGTLTTGKAKVSDVAVESALSKERLLQLAASVENRSQHPLAQAIVSYTKAQNIQLSEARDFRSLTGAGVTAQVEGKRITVASPNFFAAALNGNKPLQQQIEVWQEAGKTVILVSEESAGILGLIAIQDAIRPNARRAIQSLRAQGAAKVVMLTGDNNRTAQAIAAELGIDEVYAALKPADKAAMVRQLTAEYGHTAMVGDGVNDAPALAEASVGVAMGTAGTDVALETADVALMADDLEKLAYALKLSRRTQTIVNQNLILATIVISVLVIGALGGFFTLPIAVLGHEISEFIVIGNGLRMLRA